MKTEHRVHSFIYPQAIRLISRSNPLSLPPPSPTSPYRHFCFSQPPPLHTDITMQTHAHRQSPTVCLQTSRHLILRICSHNVYCTDTEYLCWYCIFQIQFNSKHFICPRGAILRQVYLHIVHFISSYEYLSIRSDLGHSLLCFYMCLSILSYYNLTVY